MKIILRNSLFIVLLLSFTGCNFKNNDLIVLKPNLNTLTKRVDNAIERRGVAVDDVERFLIDKDPILMENFKDYDIKIRYENQITTVLLCKDNKALYEDTSCNLQIDNDYINDNKECAFYIQNPTCEN